MTLCDHLYRPQLTIASVVESVVDTRTLKNSGAHRSWPFLLTATGSHQEFHLLLLRPAPWNPVSTPRRRHTRQRQRRQRCQIRPHRRQRRHRPAHRRRPSPSSNNSSTSSHRIPCSSHGSLPHRHPLFIPRIPPTFRSPTHNLVLILILITSLHNGHISK